MSEVGRSSEYDSESRDLHQNRPTQGKLSDGSPVRQTSTKPIHIGANRGKIMGRIMV